MKPRHQITVWPAVADLMTVLAVIGLFGCLALLPHAEGKDDLVKQVREAEEELRDLQQKVKELNAEHEERKADWANERESYEGQLQEAAKNEEMFQAIQRAQSVVDQISADESLQFEQDQTLRFGDDLVQFDTNSFEPHWQLEGRAKLKEFCQKLAGRLDGRTEDGIELRDLFTVQVEGHTDTARCPGDPHCNWRISAARAAVFVALMRQEEYCPGGADLNIQPVGYADTNPPGGNRSATQRERRRISVRLIPNYEAAIGLRGIS